MASFDTLSRVGKQGTRCFPLLSAESGVLTNKSRISFDLLIRLLDQLGVQLVNLSSLMKLPICFIKLQFDI